MAAVAMSGGSLSVADDPAANPPAVPAVEGAPAGDPQAAAAAQFAQPQTAAPGPDATSPYPTAERWVRRSQQLRAASARDAVPKPNDAALPPLPPMELPPAQPQFAGQAQFAGQGQSPGQDGAYAQPSPQPYSQQSQQYSQQFLQRQQADYMAQRPTSPAQMPGGTQFREGAPSVPALGPLNTPDLGTPSAPEKVKKPSELPKVTQILPYADYEPDPKVARENPCENLCPTPDGKPCRTKDGRILDCPKEVQLAEGPFQPRLFAPSMYAWEASNICYNPLYFEDPQLERYGHTYPFFVQPFVSIGRFTVQAIGLPYQMVIDPCYSHVFPLGYYRPGECAPKLIYQIPLNAEAALAEAGTIAGVYFLFPHSAW